MKRVKILVIDDDESLRRVLEYNLAQEGYAVLTASSGEQGLELLRKEGADLVLTDVRMAGLDGLQVLERARHPGHHPHRLRDHRDGRGGHEGRGLPLHQQALQSG
jgi:DNA-binding response OmpR family regulator